MQLKHADFNLEASASAMSKKLSIRVDFQGSSTNSLANTYSEKQPYPQLQQISGNTNFITAHLSIKMLLKKQFANISDSGHNFKVTHFLLPKILYIFFTFNDFFVH